MSVVKASPLPRSGPIREALREKGQFWTPDWVADFMTAYVLQDRPDRLLDPALGEGAFFHAAKRYAKANHIAVALHGYDIDKKVLEKAALTGLKRDDLQFVEMRDFALNPSLQQFPAIIANPPYIRHHRLSIEKKKKLKSFAENVTGMHIDGRAGLHVYFFLRALKALESGGRLAYIVSADICEGVFARVLWQWVSSNFRLDAVITFSSDATPFPNIDTNAIVFLIKNDKPQAKFDWIRCLTKDSKEVISQINGYKLTQQTEIELHSRPLKEALLNGLSRPPDEGIESHYTLRDFAFVMRGIATGDNDFFFMTEARARMLGIPPSLLIKAIGRTRDIDGDWLDTNDLKRLEANDRPTRLLNINGILLQDLPRSVQEYIEAGRKKGLPEKALIKTRKPWYRMETRKAPPILFAYLGRRNARFIRNKARVVPLTSFLCIYALRSSSDFIDRLWAVLSHPKTVANLIKVGKSYGADAIKVEPRALERLPLPEDLIKAHGLDTFIEPKQTALFQ
ncbi:MAG: N-6 DNA methylase [Thermodesulfobacteriota bacterium]